MCISPSIHGKQKADGSLVLSCIVAMVLPAPTTAYLLPFSDLSRDRD